MNDAGLTLIATVAIALVGSGGLGTIAKLVYDIRTGRAATQRRHNRDSRQELDIERELRILHQLRAADLERLAIAAGVPRDKLPPAVDTSRLYSTQPDP